MLLEHEHMMPPHRDHASRRRRAREAEPGGRKPQLADRAAEHPHGRAAAAERAARAAGRLRQELRPPSCSPLAGRRYVDAFARKDDVAAGIESDTGAPALPCLGLGDEQGAAKRRQKQAVHACCFQAVGYLRVFAVDRVAAIADEALAVA